MYRRVQSFLRHITTIAGGVVALLNTANPGRLAAASPPMPAVRFDQGAIPPDVPGGVLIGEDFTFRIRFRNAASGGTGYALFADLVLNSGGANQPKPCPCDGLTFVNASLIGVNGSPLPLVAHHSTAPCTPSSAPVLLSHPFAGVGPVLVPPGAQLVTLELPFGSVDATQPEGIIEVTAHVSQNADHGFPLSISARSGFRYGATPMNDAPPDWPVLSDVLPGAAPPANQQIDSASWAKQALVTPTVATISRSYLGWEGETATGPNFPRQYKIIFDAAPGQTLQNIKITDHLPNNVAFLATSMPACFTALTPAPGAAHSGLANDVVYQCQSLTGHLGPDAVFLFSFFIPELDANGNPVLRPNCRPVHSDNDIRVEADWTPLDPCDPHPFHVIVDVAPIDDTLFDKCLTIHKEVADMTGTAPAHPIPGDTLGYSLYVDLSDFRTMSALKVTDLLSDGQTLQPASLMLTVTDQCGTTTGPIPATAWTASASACVAGSPPTGTKLEIDVSAALTALAGTAGPLRHQNGIVTGGHATALPSVVPAAAVITFQTTIDDTYRCPPPPGHDAAVGKDDVLTNEVTIDGITLNNGGSCATIPTATLFGAIDKSATDLSLVGDFLEKSVYAVERGGTLLCGPGATLCPALPHVMPSDLVTFRVTKTVPSEDAEHLTVHDWAPQPAFTVGGGTFNNSQCGIPAAGVSCLGPSNTLTVVPVYSADPVTNSIEFDYQTFNSTANLPKTIDILFTLEVTSTPYADGLHITNQAQECESNTFGGIFCQTAIAPVFLREPNLRVTKGIVAASNPNGVFTPPNGGPVAFNLPGTACPRFSGTIASAGLAASPIDSNIYDLDADDCVTFAIVVENTGGAPAFDIVLKEEFPLGPTGEMECYVPDFSTLCVTDGAGTAIPFTTLSGFLGIVSIFLQNPLPASGGASGTNIAVVTFDACVVGDIQPQCCHDTASIPHYASTPAGPSFPHAGFGGPLTQTATLCVVPREDKSIVTSSEAHTGGTPLGTPLSPEPLALGEIVRFRLRTIVPETTWTNTYKVQDVLPAGLSYLPGSLTSVASIGLTVSQLPPAVTASTSCAGATLLFDLGTVTNTNSNAAQETIDLEFDALLCNIPSNQNGTILDNSFDLTFDVGTTATSNTVPVVVVEPNLVISKEVSRRPVAVGGVATYTITVTNNGTATAFDVHLADVLPRCLTNLNRVRVSVPATNHSTASAIDLTINSIPVNGVVVVRYRATMSCLDCMQLTNTATVTWTSLPGPSGTIPNSTNSTTPGATGSFNGERNGAGGVNDYSSTATATLCCALVKSEASVCDRRDGFTDTITLTNFTNATVTSVGIVATSPANVTITPTTITIPPLAPGASTVVTVSIAGAGAVAGGSICYDVILSGGPDSCHTNRCTTLASCCAPPPVGMVAWYPMDELSGATVINDIAPAPGSMVNDAGATPPGMAVGTNGPHPVAGTVNGALLVFDPIIVEVPAPPLSELNLTGSFSIDAWIAVSECGGAGFATIVDKTSPNSGYALYVTQPTPGGLGHLELRLNGSTFTSINTLPTSAQLNTWVHVAVAVNASSGMGTFYINGVPAGAFPAIAPLPNSATMLIGKRRLSPFFCEISIDELEIFNRAITQSEVEAIVDAGSFGKCRR